MNVKEAVFSDILCKNTQYRVPFYQRSYQWSKEQWNVLWDDIVELCEKRSGVTPKGLGAHEHFFGAIVRRPAHSGGSIHIYHLIDGQQRLATVMMVIRAIASELGGGPTGRSSNDNQELARSIETQLQNVGAAERDLIPRLVLSKDDKDAFERAVRGECGCDDGSAINEAAIFFRREVRRWLGQLEGTARNNAARRLWETITSGLSLALLTLDDFDPEYEVFESLNAKGMQLEESDKVRNFCFLHLGKLPNDEMKRFHEERWLPMEQAMIPPGKKADPSVLLNRFMMTWTFLRTGWVFNESKLCGELTRYLEHYAENDSSVAFTQSPELARILYPIFLEMTEYAISFTPIAWPETMAGAGEASLRRRIQAFVQSLGLRTAAHPLLLYLLHLNSQDETHDPDALLRCFDIIESYTVRRYVCGISKGEATNQSVFAKIAHQMYQDGVRSLPLSEQWLHSRLKQSQGTERWPDDEEFARGFCKYECSTRDAFALYVLGEIESLYDANCGRTVQTACLQRVMPEKLSDDWRETIGIDALDIHHQWHDRFGNRILLSDRQNPTQSFEELKTVCQDSAFATTKDICLFEKWNAYALSARSDRLFEKALLRWPVRTL